MATTKKRSKKKNRVASNSENSNAPKVIAAKGGLTPAALLTETLATMEDDLRISKKAAADFMESLFAVVEQQISEGRPVNIAHIVKIIPRLHTKGEREVNSVFGDPTSPKVKKKYPPKVTLQVKTGSRLSGKNRKEILPPVPKMQKVISG